MSKKGKRNLIILMVFAGFFFLLYGIWYSLIHFVSETRKPVDISSTDEKTSMDALKSLPYVIWSPIKKKDLGKSSVTIYEPNLSYKGINLYYSENKPGGHFFDMHGNILHTFVDKTKEKENWQLIEPYADNSFVVLIARQKIFMIDWDSNIKWTTRGVFHHDISIADNGDVYTLSKDRIMALDFCLTEPIINDWLVILTKDGKIKKKISFAKMILRNKDLFWSAIYQEEKRYDSGEDVWDIFHTNSVEIINKDIFSGDKKLFKKGDVLFCIRHLNLIGVIDVQTENIIWSWGTSELDFPHHPSLLENGNILIFDNGFHRKYSRVVELNPVTRKIEWEYKGNPPESFFSQSRGSAQRLPNGNTLIAESDKGHVIEITYDGKIVWEFYNPEQKDFTKAFILRNKRRATIYRMMRIIDPEKYPYLKK